MNKAFKAIWSDARQSFVTTSEKQNSHGKRAKVSVAICAAMLAFGGAASAAYVETGTLGDKASWETAEYNYNWGLGAMKASSAYALGYFGQNTMVAVMDSAAWLGNVDLDTPRITATHVTGTYGSSGNRYPQSIYATINKGVQPTPAEGQPFTEGEEFDVTGNYTIGLNDAHGTQVTGVIGAERNGEYGHGVAFKADVIVGNTGANDNNNYGPFQDYNYYYNGYKALADAVNSSNGEYRGGMINNSYGTNTKIYSSNGHILTPDEMTALLAGEGDHAKAAAAYSVTFSGDYSFLGLDDVPGASRYSANPSAFEWEYMYFKLKYGDEPSFLDGAYNAVKGTNVIQSWAAGNQDRGTPYLKGLYPYFNPEAEKNWLNAVGVMQTKGDNNQYMQATYCKAGLAKWWSMAGPTAYPGIGTTYVTNSLEGGRVTTTSFNGTSASDPQITGAFTVLQSRYPSMTAIQVKDVMYTTATHIGPNGKPFTDWTAAEGTPDVIYGWGMPDLDKGMYGPGQFLDHFEYRLAEPLDVWSNDITEAGLQQREKEDKAWMEATKNGTDPDAGGDYTLGDDMVVLDGNLDFYDNAISPEQAKQWRAEYYAKRAAYIQNKIDNDLYKGKLVKSGTGTLVMTGNNSYTGGTEVREGQLFGFTESFGSGAVNVNGGTFGVLATYNDQFTQKGELHSVVGGVSRAEAQKATVVVNDGGTFAVIADQDVQLKSLTFNEGAQITVTSLTNDAFEQAWDGNVQVGTVTAETLEGANNAIVTPDYALVDHTITVDGNKITGVLEKSDKTLADYANNGNGVSVANALMADEALFSGLVSATKDEARQTIASLANDIHVTANAMTVANGQSLVRAIKDQAIGIDGAARVADVDDGRARLWMSAVGNWSKMDRAGSSKLKSDFYTGLVGLEADINVNNKVGVFFGAGKTKSKGGADGKIDSDDLHFGIYGQSKISDVRLNYGFAYSHQDRDAGTALFYRNQAFASSPSYNAKLAQVFGEVAYTGLNLGTVNVEPYVGLAWMHLSADGFNSDYAGGKASTSFDSQNLAVTNVGARVKVPFEAGAAKLKAVADVNWTQYMGDTRGKSTLKLGNGATAKIQSEKLSAVAAVGVGLEAQLGKSASLGVSYYGAFGSKIKSNGVGATFKYAF
ncbi:autotransporter domain-containing protein [uncultured Parasutterella sp.]|uniref:autotransporter domain-containing protein n=1 Tax=uncultured Parasutterella sp. TaxID=1263098 RepID=UPI0025B6B773|nr:autotransporter domain-containing protein [uncultured Parasutterella sp.]